MNMIKSYLTLFNMIYIIQIYNSIMKKIKSNKILRHQQAKQKYKNFETAQQDKLKLNKVESCQPLKIPQPGQFFVLPATNKKQLKKTIRPQSSTMKWFNTQQSVQFHTFTQYDQAKKQKLYPAITKNIKIIVDKQEKQYLSPTAKVIPELVNQHLQMINQENKNQKKKGTFLTRPISAELIKKISKQDCKSIDKCQLIQNAYDFDRKFIEKYEKKPPSFITKRHKKIIKHIQGYNTIQITREDIDPKQPPVITKQSPYISTFQTKGIKKSKSIEKNQLNFLPIQYYLQQNTNSQQLIEMNKNSQGIVEGFSKWFDINGKFEWKPCFVQSYDQENQRWRIRWKHNNIQKYVGRSNLRFLKEDAKQFEKKLNEAQKLRNSSEIFLKYNYMIDLMNSPTSEISQQTIKRIRLLLDGYSYKLNKVRNPNTFHKLTFDQQFKLVNKPKIINLENALNKEYKQQRIKKCFSQIQKLWIRANHQIQFNASLPFNQEKKIIFQNYLPKQMFQSVMEAPAPQTNLRGCINPYDQHIQTKNRIKAFINTFNKIQETSHIANQYRLKTLRLLRKRQIQIEDMSLWIEIKLPCSLTQLKNQWRQKIQYTLHQVYCRVSDSQHEAGTELDKMYLDRKNNNQQNYRKINNQVSRFIWMINHRYQLALKQLYQRSILTLCKQIKDQLNKLKNYSKIKNINQKNKQFEIIQNYRIQTQFYTHLNYKLLITIDFILQNNRLEMIPSLSELKNIFKETHDFMIEKLNEVKCVEKSYLSLPRSNRLMKVFQENDETLINMKSKIEILNEVFTYLQNYFAKIKQKVAQIFQFNLQAKKKILRKGTYDQFSVQLHNLQDLLKQVQDMLPQRNIRFLIFQINNNQVRDLCKQKISELSIEIYKLLMQRIKKQNQKVSKSIEQMIIKLSVQPTDIEGMTQLADFAQNQVGIQLTNIYSKIAETIKKMDLLTETKFHIGYQDFRKSWEIYSKPLKVKNKQQKCIRLIQTHYKKLFSEQLAKGNEELIRQIQQIGWKHQKYSKFFELDQIDKIAFKYNKLYQRISKAKDRCQLINRRQTLIGWKLTDFSQLHKIEQMFLPYYQVWILAKNYYFRIPNMMIGPFNSIERKMITQEVEAAYTELEKYQKGIFRSNIKMAKVTYDIRDLYGKFQKYLPLINSLRNPDLRQRHWNRISKITKIDTLNENYNGSLENLIELNAMNEVNQLIEISQTASKQLSYQKNLNKLKREWRQMKMSIISNGNLQLIDSLDQLTEKVESDIIRIQTIISSPFIKFLEAEIISWRNFVLYKSQQLFETLKKLQDLWLQLYPIFSLGQLQLENTKFLMFQKMWKTLIHTYKNQSSVTQIIQTKTKQHLSVMMQTLQMVRKGLSSFFEQKREIYSRFWLFNDEELVHVYSKAKNWKIENYIEICFKSIKQIHLQQNNIDYLISKNKQKLIFKNLVNLNSLPQVIFQSIEKQIVLLLKNSLNSCMSTSSSNFLQILIANEYIKWTHQLTSSINQNSFEHFLNQHNNQLNNNIQIVRKNPLSSIANILFIKLHIRDISTMIFKTGIRDASSFIFLMQIKHYLYKQGEYNISCGNIAIKYSYQYFGDSDSYFIITPLTDRCFRSIFTAFQCIKFGTFIGNSASGKKETIKQLAHFTGKLHFDVYSNQLIDKQFIIKMFQGICRIGSWITIGDASNLTLQSLSLIANCLELIMNATSKQSKTKTHILIEGQNTILDTSCSVFFTLKPNYKQNIPTTLRELCRNITIYKPETKIMIQSLLFVHGFVHYMAISQKIIRILDICKELEYEPRKNSFGLHYASQIAKQLIKCNENDDDEFRNIPKIMKSIIGDLISENINRVNFDHILSDYFPEYENQEPEGLINYKSHFQQNKLAYDSNIQLIANQIHKKLNLGSVFLLFGNTMTAKSTYLNIILKSQQQQFTTIILKAEPFQVLFGDSKSEGIIPKAIKKFDSIIFDGAITQWNQLLVQDSIIVFSGTRIVLKNKRFIFETSNIIHSSPSFISKCVNKMYLAESISTSNLLKSWIQKLPQECQTIPLTTYYEQLIKYLLEPMVEFISVQKKISKSQWLWIGGSKERNLEIQGSYSEGALIRSFLKLFQGLIIRSWTTKNAFNLKSKNEFQSSLSDIEKSELFAYLIFSTVWSFGAVLGEDSRKSFSKEFKHLCKRVAQLNLRGILRTSIPADQSNLFEIFYQNSEWIQWISRQAILPDSQILITSQLLKTSFILDLVISQQNSMLLLGKPSSFKNTSIKYFLDKINSKQLKTVGCFSSSTSSVQARQLLELNIQKQRRRKGVFGPPVGYRSIVYIADISMAKKDKYEIQSALQLLREKCQLGGWYDVNQRQFKNVLDITMCLSDHGQQSLDSRLLKHFNVLCVWEVDQDRCRTMFRKIIEQQKFFPENLIERFVKIVINLHKITVRQYQVCHNQQHYRFGFKNMLNVITGTLRLINKKNDISVHQLLKYWINETKSVYLDRMINKSHKTKLYYTMNNVLLQQFHIRYKEIFDIHQDQQQIVKEGKIFCELNQKSQYILQTDKNVRQFIETMINTYNLKNSQKINVHLFRQLLTLLCKISKNLTILKEHILTLTISCIPILTITKIIAFIKDISYHQYQNHNDFKQFTKSIMKDNRNALVYLSNVNTDILQIMNIFLKTGSLTIFNSEERQSIISELKMNSSRDNDINQWELYLQNLKKKMKVVTNWDIRGQNYRNIINRYLGFVYKCTIIYVPNWSDSYLTEITTFQLNDTQLVKYASFFKNIHNKSIQLLQSNNFSKNYGITLPKRLEHFANVFNILYNKQKRTIQSEIWKYKICIGRKRDFEIHNQSVKLSLANLKDYLIKKSVELEFINKSINTEINQKFEEEYKNIQQQLIKKQNILKDLNRQCMLKLAYDINNITATKQVIQQLDYKDITYMKSFKSQNGLRILLEAIALLIDKKKKEEQLWKQIYKQLNDPTKLLKKLQSIQPNQINERIMQRIKLQFDKHAKQLNALENKTCRIFIGFVQNILRYFWTYKQIQPLRNKVIESQKLYESIKSQYDIIEGKMNESLKRKKQIIEKAELCSVQIKQSKNMIAIKQLNLQKILKLNQLIIDNYQKWDKKLVYYQNESANLFGNTILSTTSLLYFSHLQFQRRALYLSQLYPLLQAHKINYQQSNPVFNCFYDKNQIQRWIMKQLPNDPSGHQNAVIFNIFHQIKNQIQFKYFIILDHMKQASKWIYNQVNKPYIVKRQGELYSKIDYIVNQGGTIIFECYQANLPEYLINMIQQPNWMKKRIQLYIICQNEGLIINSKNEQDALILNFSCTCKGLKDQILITILKQQQTSIYDQNLRITIENNEAKTIMSSLQDQILSYLKNINEIQKFVDDDKLINNILEMKTKFNQLDNKIKQSRYPEERIAKVKNNYDPVSQFTALLFTKLALYMKSCKNSVFCWQHYLNLIKKAIRQAQKPLQKNIKQKAALMEQSIKNTLNKYIGMTLKKEQRIMIGIAMLVCNMQIQNKFDESIWNLMFKLNSYEHIPIDQTQIYYTNIFTELDKIKALEGILNKYNLNRLQWRDFIKNKLDYTLPKLLEPYNELPPLYSLVLLKLFKKHEFIKSIRTLISNNLGANFLIQKSYSIEQIFPISSSFNHILVESSLQQDIFKYIKRFSIEKNIIMNYITLSSANEQKIENLLQESAYNGSWVVLVNSQYNLGWLSKLRQIIQDSEDNKGRIKNISNDFRIWITVNPDKQKIPDILLKKLVKIKLIGNQSIKQNILDNYKRRFSSKVQRRYYNSTSTNEMQWKKMFMALTIFHSIAITHNNFCSKFTIDDFDLTFKRIKQCLDSRKGNTHDNIIQIIRNTYGENIQTQKQSKILYVYIKELIVEEILTQNHYRYDFTFTAKFQIPDMQQYESLEKTFIYCRDNFPSSNQLIIQYQQYEIYYQEYIQYNNLINILGSHTSNIQINQTLLNGLLQSLPKQINIQKVAQKYIIKYEYPFNTLINIQAIKYNILIKIIEDSLHRIQGYFRGATTPSVQLQNMLNCIKCNKIPEEWKKMGYPSNLTFVKYMKNFKKRIQKLMNWIDQGSLKFYRFQNMFCPNLLINCLKQKVSRQNTLVQQESLVIDIKLLEINQNEITQVSPNNSLYINGLIITNALWNEKEKNLQQQQKNMGLYKQKDFPIIMLSAIESSELKQQSENQNEQIYFYECPVQYCNNELFSIKLRSAIDEDTCLKKQIKIECKEQEV